MKRSPKTLCLLILLVLLSSFTLAAGPPRTTDLDFAGADLRDVFRALAAQFQVDIVVHDEVQDKVTLHLSRVTLQEAFKILQDTYQLDIQLVNNVYRVGKAYGERCNVTYQDGLLTLDTHAIPFSVLLSKIRDESRANIVFPDNPKRISLTLYNIPLANALETIAQLGGYTLDQNEGVYTFRPSTDTSASNLVVRFQDNLLSIEAQNASLSSIAKEITKRTGVSLVPDNSLQANINVYFHDLPLVDGLKALASANGLRLVVENASLYRLVKGSGGSFRIQFEDNRLSVDAPNIEITQVLDEIARAAKVNIVSDQDVRGAVTVRFDSMPLASGLTTILEANGYTLEVRDNLFLVHKKNAQQGVRIDYDPDSQLFNVEISNNATLASVISQMAQKASVNIVIYANVNAPLNNVFLHGVTLEKGLDLLLRGTSFIYKKQGETILVGDGANLRIDNDLLENRIFYLTYIQAENVLNALPPNFPRQYFIVLKDQNALAVSGPPDFLNVVDAYLKALDQPKNQIRTEVVHIQNMKAEDILKLFPASIPKTDLMVIKEGNAIAVTGTQAYIDRVKGYIAQVDLVNPMILFDIMVIQINDQDHRQGGLTSILQAVSGDKNTIKFDANTLSGDILIPGSDAAKQFKISLKAAVEQNKAKLWANPQITALNGSTANFKVTTKDQIAIPYTQGSGSDERTLYNTVTIETGIQINLTPWVSASNDINLQIKPSISQSIPKDTSGTSTSDSSLTDISTTDERSVETSIRVKDNATIIIGGLRQKLKSHQIKKVPFLGDIPYLGKLFQYNDNQENDSEFIIVITPKLLDSADAVRQAAENSVQNYSEPIRQENPLGKKEDPVTGDNQVK